MSAQEGSSSAREAVYAAIRRALAPLPVAERAAYPEWDDNLAICRVQPTDADPWDRFANRLAGVNGTPVRGLAALGVWLREFAPGLGYVDPQIAAQLANLPEWQGLNFSTTLDRAEVDRYVYGVTRATGAIVETGTIILNDRDTSRRLGALAPWVHAAIVDRASLWPDIPTAVRQLGDDPNVIWVTGPSKTADVEGILIEGVHGPGRQIACLVE